jgi:hypothetical protein
VTQSERITKEEALRAIIVLMMEYNAHHGFELTRIIKHIEQNGH